MKQKQHFKNRALAAVLLLLMAVIPQLASAYDFEVDGIYYNINGNNATVTYKESILYSNYSGAVNIPSTVTFNGTTYSVTEIGDNAFSYSGLTSVTIPNSVTTIGDWAFQYCTGLTSVTIPNSVTSIGWSAFRRCSGLTSVTIGNSVTSIGDYAFYNCTGLTSVTIPNSVTTIGDWAFQYCTGLTSVTIGNSVTSIGQRAFYGCTGLTSVTIGNSVTTIGSSAFYNCTALKTVNWNAKSCPDFSSAETSPFYLLDITTFNFGSSVQKIPNYLCYSLTGLTTISIPNSVASIGNYAFYSCSGLTSVTIGSSIASIGSYAFSGCSKLTSVTIPNSVTTIGSFAFYNCTGLTSVTIGNSVTTIGSEAFSGCTGLKTVNWNAKSCPDFSSAETSPFYLLDITTFNFGSSVQKIPNYLCYSLTGLTTISIPNSVASIGNYAFYSCSGLTSVTIGSSIASIGSYAFSGCSKLTSVTIPNSVTTIGSSAFRNCTSLTSMTIPNSVTTIGSFAFSGCSGLTSVTIGNSVTTIGSSAFSGCSGLTSVTIGNSVTTIGSSAFYNCTSLTSMTIPNSVTTIGSSAFNGCTSLTSVTIGNSVTSIGGLAFASCTGLTNIFSPILHPENVTLGNDVFDGVDKSNCILTIPGGTLSFYQNANQWKDFLNMVFYTGLFYTGLFVAPDVAHVRGAEHRVHELSIDMSNDEAISGVQFLMTLPPGVSLATDSYGYYDVWLDDARRARNHSVSVEPRSGNKYFVLISSPTNKTFSGNIGDILHMNIKIDQYHSATGDYPITISDIILAEPDETQHNTSNAQSTVRMSYLVGDANADVEVDVADYVVTANYILGRDTGAHFYTDAANANYTNNTAINVTDLVAITNIALELRDKEIKPDVSGYQQAPALTMPDAAYNLKANVIEAGIDKTVIAVAIDNDEQIAAMQLDIDLPDGMTLESAAATDRACGMSVSYGISTEGKARVMLSSFGTNEISAGSGDVIMLTLRGKAQSGDMLQFSNVVMSERNLIEHGAVGDLMLDLNDITGLNAVAYENVNIYGSNGAVIIESPVEGMARLVRINGMSREVKVEPGRNVYPVNVSHGEIIIATFNGVTNKIQF